VAHPEIRRWRRLWQRFGTPDSAAHAPVVRKTDGGFYNSKKPGPPTQALSAGHRVQLTTKVSQTHPGSAGGQITRLLEKRPDSWSKGWGRQPQNVRAEDLLLVAAFYASWFAEPGQPQQPEKAGWVWRGHFGVACRKWENL